MIKYRHHYFIRQVLKELNYDMLKDVRVGFGGGTAIAFLLNEYRYSSDIDFLCSDQQSYRRLREIFLDPALKAEFLGSVQEDTKFNADRYAIRGRVSVPGSRSIKFEIVSEARVKLSDFEFSIPDLARTPVLSKLDLFTEKLLANEDRGTDPLFLSRDIIDIAFMVNAWGDIPSIAWDRVDAAYQVNDLFMARYERSKRMLQDPDYLAHCMADLQISEENCDLIFQSLKLNKRAQQVSGISFYTSFRAASNTKLASMADFDKRIDALPGLKKKAGAGYTFWLLASDAIKKIGSPKLVDWSRVERTTIEKSIGCDGQEPQDVIDVLCAWSPGANTEKKQEEIRNAVEDFYSEFKQNKKDQANRHEPY